MAEKVQHPHPRRAKKALLKARITAALGGLAMLVGFAFLVQLSTFAGGWPVALIPLGATTILLAVIWYFSYMEELEPELYEHDIGIEKIVEH